MGVGVGWVGKMIGVGGQCKVLSSLGTRGLVKEGLKLLGAQGLHSHINPAFAAFQLSGYKYIIHCPVPQFP